MDHRDPEGRPRPLDRLRDPRGRHVRDPQRGVRGPERDRRRRERALPPRGRVQGHRGAADEAAGARPRRPGRQGDGGRLRPRDLDCATVTFTVDDEFGPVNRDAVGDDRRADACSAIRTSTSRPAPRVPGSSSPAARCDRRRASTSTRRLDFLDDDGRRHLQSTIGTIEEAVRTRRPGRRSTTRSASSTGPSPAFAP